jgi:hypothetical protein
VKFKHEIVQCSEEMGNCIATIFGDGERSVWLWQKHKAVISVWGITKEIHWTQERWFPEIDDAILTFFQKMQDWNKLYCIFLTACAAAL